MAQTTRYERLPISDESPGLSRDVKRWRRTAAICNVVIPVFAILFALVLATALGFIWGKNFHRARTEIDWFCKTITPTRGPNSHLILV